MARSLIFNGDALTVLRGFKNNSVHCCVTSPPYFGLRDYGVAGQLGLEKTPEAYVESLVGIMREVRRVLREGGTAWVNLGDSYANDSKWGGSSVGGKHVKAIQGDSLGRGKRDTGLKAKDLIGIPWRVAFALQADGWYLRQDIIWAKPNPMPESVRDRCTKAHEYLFLLSKSERYYFDWTAMQEPVQSNKGNAKTFRGGGAYTKGRTFDNNATVERDSHGNTSWRGSQFHTGKTAEHQLGRASKNRSSDSPRVHGQATRNRRSVWTVATQPYKGSHFATFPEKLITPCVRAGSPVGGIVLDPFCGSGTTGKVALAAGRNFVGVELRREYGLMAQVRNGGEWPCLLVG